jgi:CHAT domain-containing protein
VNYKLRRYFIYLLAALLTGLSCITSNPVIADTPISSVVQPTVEHQRNIQALEQQGKEFYDNGQFREAIAILRFLTQTYQTQGDQLRQAAVLGNLALAYQQLSLWSEAEQAIASSLTLLTPQNYATSQPELQRLQILAQVLNNQGSLQLERGQAEQALATWQQATALYEQVENLDGTVRSQINQARAFQSLGLYRRAIAILTDLNDHLQHQPDSLIKATSLQSLGDALQIAGSLVQSQQVLDQSLAIAQRLQNSDAIAAAQFSLGNTVRIQGELEAALSFFQHAAASHTPIGVQAQLNYFSTLLDLQQWTDGAELLPTLRSQIRSLPLGRTAIYAQINFAQNLMRLGNAAQHLGDRTGLSQSPSSVIQEAAQWLSTARQQAESLGDSRATSYAMGLLGRLYEQTHQWAIAQDLTTQALQQALSINQPDAAYRWQWQMGRLHNAQGNTVEAINFYNAAVTTLQALRKDVVSSNLSYQLGFRENSEEPVYRELISLLLADQNPSQDNLKRARQVITSLQVAELENFLQEPCAEVTPEATDNIVDSLAQTAAVIYPIPLPDRLEVIVKLPQDDLLYHYRTLISSSALQETIEQLKLDLENVYTFDAVQTGSQKLYDWIVRPLRERLEKKGVDTLVFALDSFLRSVPMAALYDGEHYLIETFAIAVTPGLDLLDPKPLQREQLNVLAVGLTEPPTDFSINFARLTNVNVELDAIAATGLAVTTIRDQTFTQETFNQEINQAAFSVVHLATHGQFSSDPHNTFLLTSNGAIAVNELDNLFRSRSQIRPDAIELLILNACETAAGDRLAALGIAGAAVRAGARSTIASLWTLDDTSSVEFTRYLYQYLGKSEITKAKAVRLAQLALLTNPQYEHPRYWATYVLVGNWI